MKDAEGNIITSSSTIDPVTYDAVITLNDDTPNDTSDDMSFTLKDINGPTASLIGDNEYKLVAVTKDVTYTNSGSDVGVDNTYSETKTVKELTFEWQAKGEKVGSDESDKLNKVLMLIIYLEEMVKTIFSMVLVEMTRISS